jgi:hypothetical protein
MTKLIFVRVYPNNSPGNRVFTDTAEFSEDNRAISVGRSEKKAMVALKMSYFIGYEGHGLYYAKYSLLPIELDIIQNEAPELAIFFNEIPA